MKKPTKAPLLFASGDQWVDENTYITNVTKAFKRTHKALSVEEKHVKSLLKIAKNNEELDGENAETWGPILAQIKVDLDAATEHQKEAAGAQEAAKNRELNILKSALELDKVDRKVLDSKFTSGSNFVTVDESATDEEVAAKFAMAVVIADFGPWAIGDLGNALQDRGLDNVIDQFCAQTGRSGSTIYGHMRLARSVAKEDRNENILPTVYKELVFPKLSDNEKEDAKLKAKLIKQAEKENWNSKEARSHADAARTVPAGKQGGDKPVKGRYLTVEINGKKLAYKLYSEEQPFVEGVMQFDLVKRLALDEAEEGGKIDWMEMPVIEG